MRSTIKIVARRALRRIRVRSTRHMYWWKGPPYNFGDWIGPYLYRARTGRDPVYRRPSNRSLTTTLATVGSLAHVIQDDCLVWGSGIIRRDTPVVRPHGTLAVRGPLTRERFQELGYPCPEIYGDPAILLPSYLQPEPLEHRPLALVPHYVNLDEARRLYGGRPDIRIVDVTQPLPSVVAAICGCHAVVSSSLHGLIVGHSYGRPAARVELGEPLAGDGVKFEDYYRAGGIEDPPAPLRLGVKITAAELVSYAESGPVPDLEALEGPLLESCPF